MSEERSCRFFLIQDERSLYRFVAQDHMMLSTPEWELFWHHQDSLATGTLPSLFP